MNQDSTKVVKLRRVQRFSNGFSRWATILGARVFAHFENGWTAVSASLRGVCLRAPQMAQSDRGCSAPLVPTGHKWVARAAAALWADQPGRRQTDGARCTTPSPAASAPAPQACRAVSGESRATPTPFACTRLDKPNRTEAVYKEHSAQ